MENKKRLVDANKLIDFIDVGHLRHPGELCYSEVDVANILLHAPTVDAVPLVRCRECKFRSSWMMNRNLRYICPESGMFPNGENDFCSYGERKEGADNEPYKNNETKK